MDEDIGSSQKDALPKKNDFHTILSLNKHIFIAIAALCMLALLPNIFIKDTNQVPKTISPTPTFQPPRKAQLTITRMPAATNTPWPTPTVRVVTLNRTSYPIAIPFIRNNNLLVYKNGKERVVDTNVGEQPGFCNQNFDPVISPDGKYVAYVKNILETEKTKDPCQERKLYIYEAETNVSSITPYKASLYRWNQKSLLEITSYDYAAADDGIDPKNSRVTYMLFDPRAKITTIQEKRPYDLWENMRGFPISSDKKVAAYDEKGFSIIKDGEKIQLPQTKELKRFEGWSPDGRYMLFDVQKENTEGREEPWYVIDTNNPQFKSSEVLVYLGGAGGPPSIGPQWYFDKGFITYCAQDLKFIDGSSPLQLSNDGGGGCHNENGFVVNSPDGEYSLIKIMDTFELHTKSGKKEKIKETFPVRKGRGSPVKIEWITDDYVVMYESNTNYSKADNEKPLVFLFDRRSLEITPVLEDAYLSMYHFDNE